MFTSAKQEYKSAYRDRRIWLGYSRYKSYMYGDPVGVSFYLAAINSGNLKNQGASVGWNIARYKSGKISKLEAMRYIKVQYRLNKPNLP